MIVLTFNEQELLDVLQAQSARYPLSEPQDAVKLLYQNEFGGRHMLTNRARALAALANEWNGALEEASAPGSEQEPFAEDLGGGFFRLNLRPAAHAGLTLEGISRMFTESAVEACGNLPRFKEKMSFLEAHLAETSYRFSAEALHDFIKEYTLSGCGNLHHSAVYNEAYHPRYRVVTLAHLC